MRILRFKARIEGKLDKTTVRGENLDICYKQYILALMRKGFKKMPEEQDLFVKIIK